MDAWTTTDTPIGPLTLVAGPDGLRSLRFPAQGADGLDPAARDDAAPLLADATAQLREYFAGERRTFDLPLDLGGTPFQRAVWERLRAIPSGATVSYAEIARSIGCPAAVRAVGAAVGRTPVPVIVPCHRAVGSDGRLTGYLGGLERKAALLALEALGARPRGVTAIRG